MRKLKLTTLGTNSFRKYGVYLAGVKLVALFIDIQCFYCD